MSATTAAKSSSGFSRTSVGALDPTVTLRWERDGSAEWTVPETWNLTAGLFAGSIYARVALEDGFWWWWCAQASSAPTFGNREQAQRGAEAYIKTHPDLLPINY